MIDSAQKAQVKDEGEKTMNAETSNEASSTAIASTMDDRENCQKDNFALFQSCFEQAIGTQYDGLIGATVLRLGFVADARDTQSSVELTLIAEVQGKDGEVRHVPIAPIARFRPDIKGPYFGLTSEFLDSACPYCMVECLSKFTHSPEYQNLDEEGVRCVVTMMDRAVSRLPSPTQEKPEEE